MKLSSIPLFDLLSDCNSILIAGAGGGFDVYSGIPLYFALRAQGKEVHLANLSFAVLPDDPVSRITPKCAKVTADSSGSETYFPERTLCRWLRETQQIETAIYSFPRCGVVPLREAYSKLVTLLQLDAIVLVDGGTDSLMRGDEAGLGTPEEDISSIAAVHGVEVRQKLLSCLGFGVDFFHGVCHAHFLEAVAALTRSNAFLGVFNVLPQMREGELYVEAIDYCTRHTPLHPSIVSTSISSAVQGHYGNHHVVQRTAGSDLWINPLMPIYWSFLLEAVYDRNIYVKNLENTLSIHDLSQRISAFRARCEVRAWDEIPV